MGSALTAVQDTLAANGVTHLADYTQRVAGIESSGDPNAKAGTSSATGLFQFTKGTWERVMPGVPFSMATDPKTSTEAFIKFTEENRQALKASLGREPEGWELYAAHFAGSGAAKKVLSASDDTALSDVFSAKAMSANPHLAKLGTVGNWKQWVQAKYNGDNKSAIAAMAGAPEHGGGGAIPGEDDTFGTGQGDDWGSQVIKAMMNGDSGGALMAFAMILFSALMGGQMPSLQQPQQQEVAGGEIPAPAPTPVQGKDTPRAVSVV